ncbi:hypothetical protein ACQJBY_054224 [Aegilops geniculata]
MAFGQPMGDSGADDVFAALPSPRVVATHLPCSLLPRRMTAEKSGCRIVYICRDPKTPQRMRSSPHGSSPRRGRLPLHGHEHEPTRTRTCSNSRPPPPYTFEEAFELFCDGICVSGPQWRHVVGYWEVSRKRPEKVLFVRYEHMLRDPVSNVRKLAEFMGCPFSSEEEAAGVVQAIVELCSF